MKRKKTMHIVGIALCIAVLCCISFFLGGAALDSGTSTPTQIEVDMKLNGSLLDADGNILKTFPLEVIGPIVQADNVTQLDFLIQLPDEAEPEIGWKHEPLNQGHRTPLPWELSSEYYVWFDYCFNYDKSKYQPLVFALSAEKQYLIAYWNDGEDHILVAAADPDATVAEIQEYFSKFITDYANSNYILGSSEGNE